MGGRCWSRLLWVCCCIWDFVWLWWLWCCWLLLLWCLVCMSGLWRKGVFIGCSFSFVWCFWCFFLWFVCGWMYCIVLCCRVVWFCFVGRWLLLVLDFVVVFDLLFFFGGIGWLVEWEVFCCFGCIMWLVWFECGRIVMFFVLGFLLVVLLVYGFLCNF